MTSEAQPQPHILDLAALWAANSDNNNPHTLHLQPHTPQLHLTPKFYHYRRHAAHHHRPRRAQRRVGIRDAILDGR
jgi:hypothetical protein